MSLQDWVAFARSIIGVAALGLAILYFLEWSPFDLAGLQRAHRNIWKRPKQWQRVAVCALWGFIIAATMLLIWARKSH